MDCEREARSLGLCPRNRKRVAFGDPSMSFGPVYRTWTFATSKGRCVQAEGCPVKTITFPKYETQTEISLDIGSPSFHYVDDN